MNGLRHLARAICFGCSAGFGLFAIAAGPAAADTLTIQGSSTFSANILTPTNTLAAPKGRRVIWSHPAFANRCVYARNDKEIICVSMAE